MFGYEPLDKLWNNLIQLGPKKLGALGLVGLAVFVSIAFGSYYASRSDYDTLYAGLSTQDVGRIGAALREAGVEFDVSADGTKVMVRRDETAKARMLLAERGLPSSATSGYELFDKLGPIGLTSFMQEVTRVRAIEGELARTIQAMRGIKSARVHIVLPETGSFRRGRQKASASVVIRTELSGDPSAARAIRHLVAAAVPGLTMNDVSVLGTDGTVLASAGDEDSTSTARMIELEKSVTRDLTDNVRKTLTPYLGLTNFEVSVAARLNMDKRQVNETQFDPDSKVERSLRVVKEKSNRKESSGSQPVGVEQNVPDEAAGGNAGDNSARSSERREDLTNYELNSKTTQTISQGYRIDAITIAVVINKKRLAEVVGQDAKPESVDAQLKEVERLVSTAAGVDVNRGDQISVVAVDFAPALAPEAGLGTASLVGPLIGLATGLVKALTVLGLVFIVVTFGLRPVTRLLLEDKEEQEAQQAGGGAIALESSADVPGAAGAVAGVAGALPNGQPIDPNDPSAGVDVAAAAELLGIQQNEEPNLIEDITTDVMRASQRRLEQMIALDEDMAANILKQWMRERVA